MIQKQRYGSSPDGQDVDLFTLANRHGLKATLTNFGAILTGLEAPDRHGKRADVTLGHDTLAGWISDKAYLGATVGRFANRIAHGRFTLDGRTYQLATNDGPNHLHGGRKAFHKFVWETVDAEDAAVEFRRVSPDGEEGYPGTLTATVRYTLTDDNELRVEFRATTDKPTIVNLAHHSYWNLAGDPRSTILDHELTLHADQYLPVGTSLIPTGERAAVAGTPMDFTKPNVIGKRIAQVPGGYDHCWVVRGAGGTVRPAARLREPVSGRVMEIATDQPGIQFYSGNFLDGSIRGKGGVAYQYRCGLCLETQRWPDSPNQPGFPSPVLRPGETYFHTMVHRFGVE
jgi:aldose 1-epimerase